jgi:hypothetical protein
MRGAVLALTALAAFALLAGALSVSSPRRAQGGESCFLPLIMGDMSGDRGVTSTDALWELRRSANLFLPHPPCSPEDIDCSGVVNAVDALKILRYVAELEVFQNEPCTNIGGEIPP